jgi:hypothetical protein
MEAFSFDNNRYQLHAFADAEGKASSAVLPGFEVESSTIFGTGES